MPEHTLEHALEHGGRTAAMCPPRPSASCRVPHPGPLVPLSAGSSCKMLPSHQASARAPAWVSTQATQEALLKVLFAQTEEVKTGRTVLRGGMGDSEPQGKGAAPPQCGCDNERTVEPVVAGSAPVLKRWRLQRHPSVLT